jgi:guanine deaminase
VTASIETQLYRAAIVNPLSESEWEFYPQGGLLVDSGRILACGDFESVRKQTNAPVQELEGLIVPGFVDVHIHWVQQQVRGRFHESLLTWLNNHIWAEEVRFADADYARVQAEAFFDATVRAGTVMGMTYSSVHRDATLIAYSKRRGDWVIGNSIMDTAAPETLIRFNVADEEGITAFVNALGPQNYAITPRFALSCSQSLLNELGRLARKTGCFVQTHLSESTQEVREVLRRFSDADNYTQVYDRAGLLTPRTVLGHCIHLSTPEWRCLAQRGCWIAHCPSSNEALDSGRMDLTSVREHRIPWALGSDVGAGPSQSLLNVMQRFLAQHTRAGIRVDIKEALFRATLAGARALGRGDIAGNLQAGKRADFVLLPRPGTDTGTDPKAWLRELIDGEARDLEQRPLGTWLRGVRQVS